MGCEQLFVCLSVYVCASFVCLALLGIFGWSADWFVATWMPVANSVICSCIQDLNDFGWLVLMLRRSSADVQLIFG